MILRAPTHLVADELELRLPESLYRPLPRSGLDELSKRAFPRSPSKSFSRRSSGPLSHLQTIFSSRPSLELLHRSLKDASHVEAVNTPCRYDGDALTRN